MRESGSENPYRIGDQLVFAPDDRTKGWYQNAFDRWGIYPGYVGVVTSVSEDDLELDGKVEAAMHFSQFRLVGDVSPVEREAMVADYKRRIK